MIRFNEQGPDGLVNKSSPSAPGKLTDKHKAFLAQVFWLLADAIDHYAGNLC